MGHVKATWKATKFSLLFKQGQIESFLALSDKFSTYYAWIERYFLSTMSIFHDSIIGRLNYFFYAFGILVLRSIYVAVFSILVLISHKYLSIYNNITPKKKKIQL